jgi:hypothetical protein
MGEKPSPVSGCELGLLLMPYYLIKMVLRKIFT